jgi:hypothetical protein
VRGAVWGWNEIEYRIRVIIRIVIIGVVIAIMIRIVMIAVVIIEVAPASVSAFHPGGIFRLTLFKEINAFRPAVGIIHIIRRLQIAICGSAGTHYDNKANKQLY